MKSIKQELCTGDDAYKKKDIVLIGSVLAMPIGQEDSLKNYENQAKDLLITFLPLLKRSVGRELV